MNILFYIFGSVLAIAPVIAGLLLKFFPPKKINSLYGFNTKITMSSQKAWDYAHKICPKILFTYSVFDILVFAVLIIVSKTTNSIFWVNHSWILLIGGFWLAILGVIISAIVVQSKTKKFIAEV